MTDIQAAIDNARRTRPMAVVVTGMLVGVCNPTPQVKADFLTQPGASWWNDTKCVMVPKASFSASALRSLFVTAGLELGFDEGMSR